MGEDELRLLEAWRAGDEASGRILFSRYFAALYRFFRAKIPDAADDLAQGTLLRCVEHESSVRDASSFRAYLFAIARNELHAWFRRRGHAKVEGTVTSLQALSASPSRALAIRTERRLLLEALRHVPLDDQVLLELHYWERLSSAELAEVVGVAPSTIRSRLAKARERLSGTLAELAREASLETTTDDIDEWAARIASLAREDGEA